MGCANVRGPSSADAMLLMNLANLHCLNQDLPDCRITAVESLSLVPYTFMQKILPKLPAFIV